MFVCTPPDPVRYSYLLGLFLGDGHINRAPRTHQLRITLDAAYPELVAECAEAIRATVPTAPIHIRGREGSRVSIVEAASATSPRLLPQHGPGRKHLRPIVLAGWQRAIVDRHPEMFLRGLIHSDGCRTVNRFAVVLPSGRVANYEYPRYFFSNLSADIRELFCEYCDRLDIRWTQSNPRNISISHRHSVARLDAFVGPKS